MNTEERLPKKSSTVCPCGTPGKPETETLSGMGGQCHAGPEAEELPKVCL